MTTRQLLTACFALVVILAGIFGSTPDKALAATSSTLTFQARLLQINGALVADGTYNVEFKLYDDASSGTLLWTETRTGADKVTVKNGYVYANLGSVTAFPGTINWDQELWLTMNVGGTGAPSWDGEMNPRFKLTAVPYAFKAAQAAAVKTADTNSASTNSADVTIRSGNATGSTSNSGNLILDAGSATNLAGTITIGGTNASGVSLSRAGSTTSVLGAFSVAEGATFTSGLTLGNTTNTTAGTLRWTGTDFEGYDGAQWKSLTLGSGLSTTTASFVSGLANVAGTTSGAAVETLVFTSATAVSNTAGVTGFTAPSAGSFTSCLIKNNAAITAGTLNLRWRVNGASTGAAACAMNSTTNRQKAETVTPGTVTFSAGDTIGIAFDTSGMTPAASNDFTVYWTVQYHNGGSAVGSAFVQGGNTFNTTAVLGTTDNNGLSLITNNQTRISISNSGAIQLAGTTTLTDNLLASGSATATTGTTTGTGTNTTTLNLTGDVFNVNDVVLIDNTTQDYYTRITADPGTGSYTVSPAVTFQNARTVTKYNIQNIGATATDYSTRANRFFQGYFLGGVVVGAGSTTISDGNIESTTELNLQTNGNALNIGGALNVTGTITGDGSGLTSLNGAAISASSISDSSLSANVALLSGTQSFSGAKTFNAGLTVGSSQTLTLNSESFSDLTGTGLSINSGSLEVSYGSLAGTSVQGDTTLTCASGSGNLSGGGNSITLGSGGSCNAINITNSPSFTTSVTSPAFTGSGAVTLSSGGASDLTLDSASNVLVLADGTVRRSGSLAFELNAASTTTFSITNTDGSNVADLTVEGAVTASSLSGSGTGITALSGTNITSGTVGDSYLSTNVAFLSGAQAFSGLKTFNAGLTIGASQTFTINSEGFTDLTGTGLTISGSALALDTTYLSSNYVRVGGNTLGGLLTIGTTDSNGISFVTGGTDKLRILSGGNVGIGNSNPNNKFNINTPGSAVANTEMVIAASAAGNKGLVIQGAISQSANFFEVQNNSGNSLAAIDAGGQLLLGRASSATGTIVLSNSTNGNNTTLASGVATTTRNITLPDESGTICLSNSDNCGYVRLASGSFQTDGSNNNTIAINKTSATGNLMVLQRSGTGVFTIANSGATQIVSTSTAALEILDASSNSEFAVDSSGNIVRVGASATDATQVLFKLDSFSTYDDTATCATTTNQGSMYYNTNTAALRACVDGTWEDVVTTKGLGLLMFGVVPDSSNATTPGDIGGITGIANSPCSVTRSAAQQLTVNPCVAYSGGRKVIVPSTNISTAAVAANAYVNVCLTGTGGQPALGTANATETSAGTPTFSANNPILCLATVRMTAAVGTIGNIWDVRTFTTSMKQFITMNSVNTVGMIVIGDTTNANRAITTATGSSGNVKGVVVASTRTASTNTINAIVTTDGHQYVKMVVGSAPAVGTVVQTTTTAGYARTSTTFTSNYANLGTLQKGIDTACNAVTNCQYSGLVDLGISR